MAQHKLFIHSKRTPCKTLESHHISMHAGTAAYHAYRYAVTASASLSTGCFSLGCNHLLCLTRERPNKISRRICRIHKCPMIDLKAMKEQDSTYCSVPFSCLSGRKNNINTILTAGTHFSKHLDIAIAVLHISCF